MKLKVKIVCVSIKSSSQVKGCLFPDLLHPRFKSPFLFEPAPYFLLYLVDLCSRKLLFRVVEDIIDYCCPVILVCVIPIKL
jgi:hypothetical protein